MLHKSKLMLPILAVIVGIAASAFTVKSNTGTPYATAEYWYEYTGAQTPADRIIETNYSNPQMSSLSCVGDANECAVKATVTLDGQGNPPAHPDFAGANFSSPEGFPKAGSGLIQKNQLKGQ